MMWSILWQALMLAHISPVSTPLPLCCKRKWSCHQSFLLLHFVMSCYTSLYFIFTLRRNYTDRQTRRVLVLLNNVEEGFCCMLLWRITHMACKVFLLHLKEKWIFLHVFHILQMARKKTILIYYEALNVYLYAHIHTHTYIYRWDR